MVRFADQRLTSYGGIVVFQALFRHLQLKKRLRRCFTHLRKPTAYTLQGLVMHLVVHILLGFRRLRDRDYYHDDPLVRRLLGLRTIPDVSTTSRRLSALDERSVEQMRNVNKDLVLGRIASERLPRITLDFDGSVQSTRRHAEGTAVGFNKKKKGARSYYPLFCTVAQTGQFLDLLHRPGNVHDSNGSLAFIASCVDEVRARCGRVLLESRLDSAFFNDKIVNQLNRDRVAFTASVPFERFPKLKDLIEQRRRWHRLNETWSFAELRFKPECWDRRFRMIAIRQRVARQRKGPLQLDLFEPRDHEYQYKVIVTNRVGTARSVMEFHHGRGNQEAVIGEAKSCLALDVVPMRRLIPNQVFCISNLLAHNLGRELQMIAKPRALRNTPKRGTLWDFESLRTLRQRLVQRAGLITYPAGKMTLTMNANRQAGSEIDGYLQAIELAA